MVEIDMSELPFDEAVELAIEVLGMDRGEAVLYVQISQGVIEGDTYNIPEDQSGL